MEKIRQDIVEIKAAIAAAKKIIITCHASPDADAYGSSAALALALKKIGKEIYLLNDAGAEKNYLFLPLVKNFQDHWPADHYDLLITCDCGDRKRIGDRLLQNKPQHIAEINIDHHISNDFFGTYSYVRSSASSTAELVYELITELEVELDQEIATAILAGLMGDTGSFNFPNTTPKVLQIAAKLLEHGASPQLISNNLFYNDDISCVKLKAEALSAVELFVNAKVAIAVVDQKLLNKFSAKSTDLEGLVDQVRRIAGIQIAVLIYRDGDRWKVSLRAKEQSADLAAVAADFGGGGHKQASGFRSTQEISVLKVQLLNRLEKELQ